MGYDFGVQPYLLGKVFWIQGVWKIGIYGNYKHGDWTIESFLLANKKRGWVILELLELSLDLRKFFLYS